MSPDGGGDGGALGGAGSARIGVGDLLGFGERKSSGLGRIGGLAPAAPAPGVPRGLAARALAAGPAAGGLLGSPLLPPGVVPRLAGLLLESGDGFGAKVLEERALLVEVLEGATTLEEADRAVARGAASGRRRTVGAGAPGGPCMAPVVVEQRTRKR